MNINNKIIKLDIANEVSRRRYSLNENLSDKLTKRLKRKYKIKIYIEDTEKIINYYQKIYDFITTRLNKYILKTTTGFTEPQFIKRDELEKEVYRKYNKEDKDVLNKIIDWVIYWEYLR